MVLRRALCAFIIAGLTAAPAALGQGQDPYKPSGKAHGFYCKGVSKKKVKGKKGTPFSQCVKAIKALDEGKTPSPAKACKKLSKKKKGKKTSNYAKCVKGGKQLLKDKSG